MAKLQLQGERRREYSGAILFCFGLTVVPALILALLVQPFGQDHVGLMLASVISGGFIYWTGANLLTGIYTSRQGVYRREEAPVRYWLNTAVVAAFTALAIYFLIHQVILVVASRPS